MASAKLVYIRAEGTEIIKPLPLALAYSLIGNYLSKSQASPKYFHCHGNYNNRL